jgi:hypothetical protein
MAISLTNQRGYMNYMLQINSTLFARVSFKVVSLPDNDYDIEVDNVDFINDSDETVELTEYTHDEQRSIFDNFNEAVDDFLEENHEALYKQLTTEQERSGNTVH